MTTSTVRFGSLGFSPDPNVDPYTQHLLTHVKPSAIQRFNQLKRAALDAEANAVSKWEALHDGTLLTPTQRRQYSQYVNRACNISTAMYRLPTTTFRQPLVNYLEAAKHTRTWPIHGQDIDPDDTTIISQLAREWVDSRLPLTNRVVPITDKRINKTNEHYRQAEHMIASALKADNYYRNQMTSGVANTYVDDNQTFYEALHNIREMYRAAANNPIKKGVFRYMDLLPRRWNRVKPYLIHAITRPTAPNWKKLASQARILMPGFKPTFKPSLTDSPTVGYVSPPVQYPASSS
jgi:hypothetical protein